jgi:hypothetical protein
MYMRLYQRTWKDPIEKRIGSILEGRCCQNATKLFNAYSSDEILLLHLRPSFMKVGS